MKIILLLTIFVGCAGTVETQKQESSAGCSEKSCGQMISCPEAMYNFKQCGRKELDKDEDGEPCEELCREL